ncbi:MAG: hypothetical protein DRP55_01240, partial [Spirochaetes bacterium]
MENALYVKAKSIFKSIICPIIQRYSLFYAKKCHEKLHSHDTGRVQKSTKYGYEDFREENKEEVIKIRNYVNYLIANVKTLQRPILNDKVLMRILYGFGTIREEKEELEQEWEEIVYVISGLYERFTGDELEERRKRAEEWANQIITELRNLALKSEGEQNEEKQANL